MKTLFDLQQTFAQHGEVISIYVRPERRASMIYKSEVRAFSNIGLEGDRYKNKGGSRQMTIVSWEDLQAVSSYLSKKVSHESVRRNILVKGINLRALKGKRFKIGEVECEYSGECHPCSRMEENLGPGGYNAIRGYGGITARILSNRIIKTGDLLTVI